MKKLAVLCVLLVGMCTYGIAQNEANHFPTLTANLLSDDQEVTFPDCIQGKKSMITLVFEKRGDYKKAQSQADDWQNFWSAELETKDVVYYEIPMMSGIYWVGSSLINSGMRKGIDEDLHNNIACFYGQKMKYAEELGIADISECYVCIVDEEGNILASEVGAISEAKKQEFLGLLN